MSRIRSFWSIVLAGVIYAAAFAFAQASPQAAPVGPAQPQPQAASISQAQIQPQPQTQPSAAITRTGAEVVQGRLRELPRPRRPRRGRASCAGFETRVPDFSDCAIATREPDKDWRAVAHRRGARPGASRQDDARLRRRARRGRD